MAKAMEDEKAVVAQAEEALAEAHLTLDLELIDRLLHPDYVMVQTGGEIETKADVLASYKTGNRQWETARSDQLDIRLHDGMAVVVGRWQASGQHGANHFDYSARFLSIWVKQDGAWRNIAYQSTEIRP